MPRGSAKAPLLIAPGGVREDVNIAAVPDGYLLSSSNWLTRQGLGRPRPGYLQVGAQVAAADRVIGIGARGSAGTATNVVAHTLTAAYNWDGSAWNAITGTWSASSSTQQVRFAAMQSSGTLYLVRANLANALDRWDGTGSFADVGGSPPRARDITTVSGRLLAFHTSDGSTTYPYRVQWSDFNDIDTWNAASYVDLSETPDNGIACRAFGPLSAGLYKEDSVWLAVAQAAKQPFQFQMVAITPGPVSPSALVVYRGIHYWLAKDGVIYSWMGSGVPRAVGTALPTTVKDTFDWDDRLEAVGWVLSLPEPELWFAFHAPDGTNKAAISLNLETGSMNAHTFAHSITAASEWVAQPDLTIDGLDAKAATIDDLASIYASIDAMGSTFRPAALVGDDTGNLYEFGVGSTDDGTAISWEFVHGWKAMAGLGNRFYFDGVASYWEKISTTLNVTLGVTVTDSLGDNDTETTSTFDVATDSNHLVNFAGLRGQWVKVRHAASSSHASLAHRGAVVMGWKRGMV